MDCLTIFDNNINADAVKASHLNTNTRIHLLKVLDVQKELFHTNIPLLIDRSETQLLQQLENATTILDASGINNSDYVEPIQDVKYSERNKCGSGSFSDVYTGGTWTEYTDNERKASIKHKVAVKVLKSFPGTPIDTTYLYREIKALSELSHDNIVKYYGYTILNNCNCLVFAECQYTRLIVNSSEVRCCSVALTGCNCNRVHSQSKLFA